MTKIIDWKLPDGWHIKAMLSIGWVGTVIGVDQLWGISAGTFAIGVMGFITGLVWWTVDELTSICFKPKEKANG